MEKDWNGNKAATWATLAASNHSNYEREERDFDLDEFYDVERYKGRLLIDKKGDVYSLLSNKILKPSKLPSGYITYVIMLKNPRRTKTEYLHRLLAETFIPNPENKETVNHINGIKNDNRLENLEWATQSENNYHAYKNNLHKPHMEKARLAQRVLSDEDVDFIKTHKYLSAKELSEILMNEHLYAISDCKSDRTFKDWRK